MVNFGKQTYDTTKICGQKHYENPIVGFFGEFQDSFLYTFVIQFVIVILMHVNVGKGKYWRVLTISSIAGLMGAIIEHGTLGYVCSEGHKGEYPLYSLMINEIFWIINEYSIPYLNLIKMEAFAKGRSGDIIKYVIYALNIPFMVFRFMIGYERMIRYDLNNKRTAVLHGYAFGVMAVADILCTFCILYFVRKYNQQVVAGNSGINGSIKHSSYTILIIVDIVCSILSILMVISSKFSIPGEIVVPFHCLKNSYVLVLASDAIIFKYSVNINSTNESSGNYGNYGKTSGNYNKSGTGNNYANNSNSNINYNTYNSFKNSKNKPQTPKMNHIADISSNKGKYNYNSSPFNYVNYDNDINSLINDNAHMSNSRSIVKNYTNIKVPSNTFNPNTFYANSPDSDSTYVHQDLKTQNFGFLNH
ncbi:hypothetical protein BCR32DRAFT_325338 [Anaeromyces robustus]|jgi:hypothetical protein|uniref:RTA1-domain-containing protein n=1 Tax=Anaeromyces robustus TaxID=1754192 RepID=A0A1Y1XIS6_9FUNG|nr:hypothetical protein BCR32DRAFT_325338 [Anaeromyces robustus]|eukprot:ORX85660.1 hypothetical protein BCR32DRAFT_325338 [Anaeromyces robustus]